MEFGKGDAFRFQTPLEVRDGGYVVRWGCYVRLGVVNIGGKVARNCRGFLTGVERDDGGGLKPTNYCDSLPLIWSYKGKDQGCPAVDLLPGVVHYLDVLCTLSFPSKLPPFDPVLDSERFELQTQVLPVRYSNLLCGPRIYRFTIQVSAEEVQPQVLRLVFDWKGKWNDFEAWESR